MSERTCDNCIDGTVCKVDISPFRCIRHIYKYNKGDICRFCHEEEVYGDLTDGLCLNCYQKLQNELREIEIEAYLDLCDGRY